MTRMNMNLTGFFIGAVLALLISFGFTQYQSKVNELKAQIQTEINLKEALLDSVSYYQNEKNEWVAEKLTIQTTIKNLQANNKVLNNAQKELLQRIKASTHESNIITAALLESHLLIDSLLHTGKTIIDTIGDNIIFAENNNDVEYKFIVGNVKPVINLKPLLLIDLLYFPNKQFIEFHWEDDKDKGYPISFSVSNSNKYYKTIDINSYAIPQLSKEVLNPTKWGKVKGWFKRSGKAFKWIGVGSVIGGFGVYAITR